MRGGAGWTVLAEAHKHTFPSATKGMRGGAGTLTPIALAIAIVPSATKGMRGGAGGLSTVDSRGWGVQAQPRECAEALAYPSISRAVEGNYQAQPRECAEALAKQADYVSCQPGTQAQPRECAEALAFTVIVRDHQPLRPSATKGMRGGAGKDEGR